MSVESGSAGSGRLRPSRGTLPNLIVIGAMKGGTSALHYYLDLHPSIAMSRPKELDFFIDDRAPDTRLIDPAEIARLPSSPANWSRGVDWYARHFPPRSPVRGESSPNYTDPSRSGVADRMASVVPHAKLVFCVRDPIARAVSHYSHLRARGRERRTLETALAEPRGAYMARSRYHAALEPYLARFPSSRIMVVSQERLLRHRRETIRSVYRFAGVDDSFDSPRFERLRNRTQAKGRRHGVVRALTRGPVARAGHALPKELKWNIERLTSAAGDPPPALDPRLHEHLAAILREDVDRLRATTGEAFAEWSI